MKKSIPNFLFAATSLIFSLATFAGGIDEVVAIVPEIVIPKLPGGFFVGGSGYYLQFSATGAELDYASVNQQPVLNFVDGNPHSVSAVQPSQIGHVLPNYSWAWNAFIGYTFAGTGKDVTLNYFHFQGSKDNSKDVVPDPSIISGNSNSPFPISSDIDSAVIFSGVPVSTIALGHVGYYANQADLTVGQFIDIGSRLQIHPNAGLRWATIHRDVSATFTSPPLENGSKNFITTVMQTTNTNSHYTGLGPIAGLDITYDLWYGFAAVGHFDVAVLAGNLHTELKSNFDAFTAVVGNLTQLNLSELAGSLPTANQFSYSATSSTIRRLVPALDTKLGLNYLYNFNDGMTLTAEIGWALSNYFNVVDGLTADTSGIDAFIFSTGGSSPASITGHSTADVGLQGLYFDLMLTM